MPEMPETGNDQQRPYLHCMMVDLIDDYLAEYPAVSGGSDIVEPDMKPTR